MNIIKTYITFGAILFLHSGVLSGGTYCKTITVYTNSHTLGRYILQNLQHFATKIDKTFKMPFVADVHDLFILHTSRFNL